MAGPLTFHEIVIVACRHDMAAFHIGLVDPVLILQHLVLPAATEAAVQNVVAALECLARAFANDRRARAQVLAQDPEAANLRFRRHLPQDARNRSAVPEYVDSTASNAV